LWRVFCFDWDTGGNHVRQNRRERFWTAAGWPRAAGFGPWMGQTILVPHANQDSVPRRVLAGTQEANHVARHVPCLALRAIGCTNVRFGILPSQSTILSGTLWTAEGWPRETGLVPWMGPAILVHPCKPASRSVAVLSLAFRASATRAPRHHLLPQPMDFCAERHPSSNVCADTSAQSTPHFPLYPYGEPTTGLRLKLCSPPVTK
jgi:hypothetical protein